MDNKYFGTKQSKKIYSNFEKETRFQIKCCQISHATLDVHTQLGEYIHSIAKDKFLNYLKRMGPKI